MVLDTNILIGYFQGDARIVENLSSWKEAGRAFFVSSVSTAEIFSLPSLTISEINQLRKFLRDNFISVPLDDFLAEACAFLRRKYGLTIADAAIVSTALVRKVPLVTRDRRLKKIREVTIVEI